MNAFANLKLRWKLVAIVIIPVLCLIYFAQSAVQENSTIVDENEQILRLSQFAVNASALVHEMQKERGVTAGFMGSKGSKFSNEIVEQRKLVDEKGKTLLAFLNDFEATRFGSEFDKQLRKAMSMYKGLSQIRSRVSGFTIARGDAIGYYTKMNAAFLEAITYLAKSSSLGELSNMATAYVNFLNSKERAGIERAVMTSVFALDNFPAGLYDRFQSLMTIQNVYLNVFKSLASDEQLSYLNNTLQGDAVDATEQMRNTAIERSQTGGFEVDPSFWFKMQTTKINLLKKVEDKLSNDLESLATKLSQDASATLTFSVTMMLSALVLTALFVYFVQRRITVPISESVAVANAIANGKLDNRITVSSKDESGQLLNALKTMQNNLSEQIEKERLQAAENNRIRQALDNVSANVMLADQDLNIIYMNDAIKHMFNQNESDLKKDLSNFRADKLVGTNIDDFHREPGYQRGLLKQLKGSHSAEISVGGRIFNIVANPVVNDRQERLGTVVEWIDLSEQRDAEKQVEKVISAAVAGQLHTRLDAERFDGFMHTLAASINQLLDAIVGPLSVAAGHIERIANGDIPELITDEYQGDFNKLKNNLNTCVSAINLLVEDSNKLVDGALAGQLSVRADGAKHQGDFRKIIEGVNNTLDAVVNPLSVAADYVNRIAKGDVPQLITEEYQGDFNHIKNNLNTCISAINLLISDADKLSEAAIAGNLSVRADGDKHQGDFRKIVVGVNDTLDAVINPLTVAANYVDRIAKGDIPQHITDDYRGDFNQLKNNLNTCIDAINLLVTDANKLAGAAVAGQLDVRADDSQHQGDFQKIVGGVNNTLDAVINPLTVAATYVDRIAKGDIPEPITDDYKGDFNRIKNNLNTCIVAINLLIEDANTLAEAAVDGQLSTRADTARHQGDFRRIIEGVNDTLDAVISPLTVAADYVARIARGDIPEAITEQYNGDFNQLKNNLNTCIEAVNKLVADADMLAVAAVKGELATRADVQQHLGDFRKIVEGVNNALDAMVTPINETKLVMEALAEGDLTRKVTGNFQGEFAVLCTVVNSSISKLHELVHNIFGSANIVNSSSQEISTGVIDLSQRTEEQASSLEETSASMEEMTGTVKQNAENANLANELAVEAQQKALAGGTVVNNAVTSMADINESSKKIADIIGVIDEIAFQTNLLALNAAVEAARAGEQGRGFAVVAGEVRSLAQRSAQAAKEIKDLIRESVSKIEDGSNLVNESGETLQDIVAAVEKVTEMISDISDASNEQTAGIEQVNKAIVSMDEMTQQNAALVEQTSANSENMAEQATTMLKLLSAFKVDSDAQTSASNVAPVTQLHSVSHRSETRSTGRSPRSSNKPSDQDGEEWEEF